MRFIHTSDWHLGRIFFGVQLTNDQSYILEQFKELVKDTNPDAIIIAGDVYDRAVPPTDAVELLNNTLSQLLLDYKIPIIMIAGNHDSPERISFANRLLSRQNLFVYGPFTADIEPIVLADSYGPVYFCPLAYAEPAVVRHYFKNLDITNHDNAMQAAINVILPKLPGNSRRVAVAHAFMAGGQCCDSERPLSVGGSGTVNPNHFAAFNYTALGHLHQPQQAGSYPLRYSGSLLKYSFAEANQRKGINIVELNETGEVKIDTVALTPRRDVRCIEGYFRDLLLSGPQDFSEDYISVTLLDSEPLLDPMGQLRQFYPNLLQIEKPNITLENELNGLGTDHRRLSDTDIFAVFFEQVTGEPLSEKQNQTFSRIISEILNEDREAKL